MNAHLCQTVQAIAEERELMQVDKQMNSKFIGIVQDTLFGSYLMSNMDTFLNEEFASWVYTSASGRNPDLIFPKPAILKPRKMWTGKQLLNMVIQQTPFMYGDPSNLFQEKEQELLYVQNGEFIAGQIRKMHFGENGQIMSAIAINFGTKAAAQVINNFQAVVNPYVLRRGISVGIRDCIPSDDAEKQLENIVQDLGRKIQDLKDTSEINISNLCTKTRTEMANVIIKDAIRSKNRIREMTQSGSKGSEVNLVQIQGLLGQQIVGGKRPFSYESGRVFPFDPKNSDLTKNVRSRGFITNSLYKGVGVTDYYCHAAGGREGIVNTGITTAKTGYSTRRISCVLEGAVVSFTGSVFNQSILQGALTSTIYGGDGIDGTKLIRHSIPLHKLKIGDLENIVRFIKHNSARTHMYNQFIQDRDFIMNLCLFRQKTDDIFWLPVDLHHILFMCTKNWNHDHDHNIDLDTDLDVQTIWNELFCVSSKRFIVFNNRKYSVGKELNQKATLLFRVSLRYTLMKFLSKKKCSKEFFMYIMDHIQKAFEVSRIPSGEPVGLIATQSLMQSTMQSTLNTFHTAGTGSSSVATGGLGYFDSLISVQTPKITITTVYLSDPSKEFMVMEAIAPPVKMLDLVSRIRELSTDEKRKTTFICNHPIEQTTVVEFEIPEDKYFKKYIRPFHVFLSISNLIGTGRVELLENGSIRLYLPTSLYSRILIDELLDIIVKNSKLTPRGKEKNSRGVIGARRVKAEKWIKKENELFLDSFTQIEIYGNFRLADLFCIDGIDCKRTTCNDISEIQATFGVCAAKQFLTKELYRTVTGSGSNVNPRYVMQAADYMVYTGRVSPITRHGMELFSPLKSAAFEQPGKVLVNAALSCKTEHMLSPTSNVVFGQEIRGIGTAIIDTIPIEQTPFLQNIREEPDLVIPFMKFTESYMDDDNHDHNNRMDDDIHTDHQNTISFNHFSNDFLQIDKNMNGDLTISDDITGEEFVMQLDF